MAAIGSELDGLRERARPPRICSLRTSPLGYWLRWRYTRARPWPHWTGSTPRDLFDVWVRNRDDRYTTGDLDVLAVYLAGHNRPPHEILAGRDKPLEELYVTSLLGMTAGTIPSVAELHDTRRRLRRDVVQRMSPQAKEFLTSFFGLSPTWDALPSPGLERLPALQWKLHNLEMFRSRRPSDFQRQNDELAALLSVCSR